MISVSSWPMYTGDCPSECKKQKAEIQPFIHVGVLFPLLITLQIDIVSVCSSIVCLSSVSTTNKKLLDLEINVGLTIALISVESLL